MRLKPAVALLFLLAPPLAAGEGRYIVCDNGLRCFKAPCPSSTVWELATGQAFKGSYPDISRLSEADQQRIRDTDALYFGRLVLAGRVERREQNGSSLIVTGIERATTKAERRHCPAG
ncbi:hypothetical protein [Sinorhizobium sp. RAC02]|uniref:hypothetical protein n=1 Tax=Sinorhizobium sp. RAC02 TaxID=1842534 RepID=UPI00083DD63E|nr:hypothetical protein [Sinorhizobium sp. RAC02]AOF88460.1 hypothetical protein BSY16_509 [Sinorhizobium sp. RAC02]